MNGEPRVFSQFFPLPLLRAGLVGLFFQYWSPSDHSLHQAFKPKYVCDTFKPRSFFPSVLSKEPNVPHCVFGDSFPPLTVRRAGFFLHNPVA